MQSMEKEQVRESEPAKQLFNALTKIINDIDQVVNELEKKELVSANITIDGLILKYIIFIILLVIFTIELSLSLF